MQKKKTPLACRVFTFIIIGLLLVFVFIPSFTVKACVTAGNDSEVVFQTSVSAKDIFAVAFLSNEEKVDRLADVTLKRTEEITKLVLDGKTDAEAANIVNSYSISKEYALLKYFCDSENSASTWLLVAAIVEIAMLLGLVACALYTYMAIQYDNKHLPVVLKALACFAGLMGIALCGIMVFALNNTVAFVNSYVVLNVLGYIFLGLGIYLPIHTAIFFASPKKSNKNK